MPYSIALYGADHALLREVTGTLDLPPGATVPVFVPGVAAGKQTVASAFLTIAPDAPRWYALAADPRVVPRVSGVAVGGAADAPRITATLENPSVAALANVSAVAFVHGAGGNVIAASATVVPSIPAEGAATATFTWNGAFGSVPLSIEVIPVIALPPYP